MNGRRNKDSSKKTDSSLAQTLSISPKSNSHFSRLSFMEMEGDATLILLPSNDPFRRPNSTSTSAVVFPTKLSLVYRRGLQSSGSPSSTIAASSSVATSSSTSTSSSLSVDFELVPIKPVAASYTSLKDLLPATAVNSPKTQPQVQSEYNISIRNRLVKQAAWAYLQPLSSSPCSVDGGLFHRIFSKFAGNGHHNLIRNNPVTSFFRNAIRVLVRVIDQLLQVLWIRSA